MRALAIVALLGACGVPAKLEVDAGVDGGGGKTDDPTTRSAPWSVSRHAWPSDPKAVVTRDFELIAELGARYVRTDAWWYAVQPTAGGFDEAALEFYDWYVDEAQRHGLGVIVILSNAPEWAKQLDRPALAAAFGAYAEKVASRVGDRVTYYQLWNEPNHVNDFPDGDTDVALFHAGRAGIERARTAIGATVPLRTVVNVLVDGHDTPFGPGWESDVRYFFERGAGPAIDVIAIDHYPGTWSIGDWGGNILGRLFALGDAYDKQVAIFEAGFSTSRCTLLANTEQAQANWIREQVPRIRLRVAHRDRFELVNWFELDDRNSGNCFDPEDNFGLVRTNRSKKPAFHALREQIATF